MENTLLLSVSDFVDLTNQTLEYAYPLVNIEGEISEYKVIHDKWISFKIKDAGAAVDVKVELPEAANADTSEVKTAASA